MHCDLVMLLRHGRRTVRYQSWVSLTISAHHSPIYLLHIMISPGCVSILLDGWQPSSPDGRFILGLPYSLFCWTLRGPLGLRAGPMAAKAEARWQQRCRHHGTAWVASESFLLLWNTFSISVESIASGGKGVNQVLALSRTCRVSPMKSTVVASSTQAPASKRILVLSCTCMVMTKTLKSGFVKAGSGLFGYT